MNHNNMTIPTGATLERMLLQEPEEQQKMIDISKYKDEIVRLQRALAIVDILEKIEKEGEEEEGANEK